MTALALMAVAVPSLMSTPGPVSAAPVTYTNLVTNPSAESVRADSLRTRTNLILNPGGYNTKNWATGPNMTMVADYNTPIKITHTTGAATGNAYAMMKVELGASKTYRARVTLLEAAGTPDSIYAFGIDTSNWQQYQGVQMVRGANGIWVAEWTMVIDSRAPVTPHILLDVGGPGRGEVLAVNQYSLLEETTSTEPLAHSFDGGIGPQGDFDYAWAGEVFNSVSYETGRKVSALTNLYAASSAISSTGWAASGGKSIRIVPTALAGSGDMAADSFASIELPVSQIAGKRLTIFGTLRLTGPQVGVTDTRARSIVASADGPTRNAYQASTAAPNEAGVTNHKVVIDVPPDTSVLYVRWYNGTTRGNGDAWWDNIAIIEGDYTGAYFDGGTPGASWTGAANQSTATIGVSSVSIVTRQNGVASTTAGSGLFYDVAQPLTWEYIVTNTGAVPLSDLVVTDSQGVPVTCPKTSLAVGEVMTCTGTGVIGKGFYGYP